jgi:hypothetical protein
MDSHFLLKGKCTSYKKNKKELIENLKVYKKTLSLFSFKKIINWRKKYRKKFYSLLKDASSQLESIRNLGYEIEVSSRLDLEEFHDKVSTYYRNIKTRDYALMVDESIYKKINDIKINDMKIVLPRTYYELRNIGDTLHNCVAGYAGDIQSGYSSIFTLNSKRTPIYCVQVRNIQGKLRIVQALGKYNKLMLPEDLLALTDYIDETFFKGVKDTVLLLPKSHKKKVVKMKEIEENNKILIC